MPKCPSCGSTQHLWDDNMYEGCNRCGYLGSFSGIVRHGTWEAAEPFDRGSKQQNRTPDLQP